MLLKSHELSYIRENPFENERLVNCGSRVWAFYIGRHGSVGCEAPIRKYNSTRVVEPTSIQKNNEKMTTGRWIH